MTEKEKAKAYDEALEIAKNEINIKGIGDTVDLCKQLFPELDESEDERVREWLVDYFKTIGESKSWIHRGIGPKQILAWLEKQKEQKPILEVFGFKVGDAVRLKDGDGRKHIIKSFEEVEGIHGPNFYHVEFEDNSARDSIYPGEEYPNGYYTQMEKFEEEQQPNIELIQRSWYMEGYHDREFGKEPKWVIKTGEGGPKHELNPRYGQPIMEEPKPVEPSDDELQRHQDELYDFQVFAAKQAKEHHISHVHDFEWHNFCAELLSYFNENHKPAEWSEEDEKAFKRAIDCVRSWEIDYCDGDNRISERLKFLRPSWKPSEEQMKALYCALCEEISRTHFDALESLYNDLKKLM